MKLVLFVLYVAIATAYDDVNDEQYNLILSSNEELQAFVKCLIDQGPCKNAFSQHIRAHMVEFYADGCKECDSKQKHYTHLVYDILKMEYPELYKALEAKYDPQGKQINKIIEKTNKFLKLNYYT